MTYTATINRSPVVLAESGDFYKVIAGCQKLSVPRDHIRVYEEPRHDLVYFEYVLPPEENRSARSR